MAPLSCAKHVQAFDHAFGNRRPTMGVGELSNLLDQGGKTLTKGLNKNLVLDDIVPTGHWQEFFLLLRLSNHPDQDLLVEAEGNKQL